MSKEECVGHVAKHMHLTALSKRGATYKEGRMVSFERSDYYAILNNMGV